MEDQYQTAKVLLKKYLEGTCTNEEKAWVDQWYLNLHQELDGLSANELADDLKQLDLLLDKIQERKRFPFLNMISIGTAAAIVLVVAGLWWSSGKHKTGQTVIMAQADLPPGTNKATLQVDGEKAVQLNEDKKGLISNDTTIRYQDGTEISKTKTKKMATVSTPLGGQYQLQLPDGTNVWLNAASSITYPTRFDDRERVVKITGEVYMEVAKDARKPFIVNTAQQQIQVLGTVFNIDAYGDNGQTVTTLSEGSIKLTSTHTKAWTVLKPGQQAVVAEAMDMQIYYVDVEEALAWKNGTYILTDQPLSQFARQIERWYDVEMDVGPYSDTRLTAIIPRNAKLSDVLNAITLNTKIKFTLEERRIKAIE